MLGQFDIFQQGNCTVCRLNDKYTGKAMDSDTLLMLEEKIQQQPIKVVLDLQNKDNIHVADIQALIRVVKCVNDNKGKIAVVSASPKTMELLHLIKINAELDILNTLDEGVHALN